MFDFTFLQELLIDLGFKEVTEVKRGESRFLASEDEALSLEKSSDGGKTPDPWLIVEARP
jgi:hypothetical protein